MFKMCKCKHYGIWNINNNQWINAQSVIFVTTSFAVAKAQLQLIESLFKDNLEIREFEE